LGALKASTSFPLASRPLRSSDIAEGVWGMKLCRVDKLAKRNGIVIKKQHILAHSDHEAVKRAEDSDDCPICDVLRDGQTVGQVL
jgi:propanediol utilization protein